MQSSRRTSVQAAGLVLAGAVAGGVLAATIGASASSPSATSPGPASYAASDPSAHGPMGRHDGPMDRRMGAPMTAGTVTAVGGKSVTIKSSTGTTTYAVDADSDIDKNGEAQLSDLKAGDAVHFSVRSGTSTIAVLHAGDEAKNRPAFGHRGDGRPCPNGSTSPRPSASATTGA